MVVPGFPVWAQATAAPSPPKISPICRRVIFFSMGCIPPYKQNMIKIIFLGRANYEEQIMPYPAGHRDRIRGKIVDSARRLFNLRGFENVSVDSIMADAGMTRGGFYSY